MPASTPSRIQPSPGPSWRLLAVLLLAALAHGMVYVLIVPPWQHYDEPNHFEYAWLLANRRHLPQKGEFDLEMRRAVQASMYAHNFFRGMGFAPDPAAEKPWIGTFDQTDDPPLYYLLAALPLALFSAADVTTQLYLARLVSLALFLLVVIAAWGLAAELAPPRSPLRWAVPFSLVLLPGSVDLMTSVNNDVGAAACMAWFVWGGVRLVKRGFSWGGLAWVLLAMLLGLFAKRTAYVALPLFALAVWLMLWRGRHIRWAWLLLAGGAAAAGLAVFSWGDAALWYRKTAQAEATRLPGVSAPLGDHVFRLRLTSADRAAQLVQLLPLEQARQLQGKTLTLGAWVWADRPLTLQAPTLLVYDGQQKFSQEIQVDTTPRFVAFTMTPAGNPQRSWLMLNPALKELPAPVEVYYDGLVLAEGSFPLEMPPVFAGPEGARGEWGGAPFENLLRNPSAESAWPYLRPWADQLGARLFPDYGQDRLSLALYTLADYPGAGWYYNATAANLLRTFWARFGWGHVPLLGGKPYRVLAGVTLAAWVGAALALAWGLLKRRRAWPWSTLLWLGVTLAAVWGLALVRGSNYLFLRPFYSNARYAIAAILPTVFLLNAGWWAWYRPLQRFLRFPAWGYPLLYGLGFLSLDLLAVMAITRFYYW